MTGAESAGTSYANAKVRLLNPSETEPERRTYIVIGLGRSGTSFVASVLRYLDVFLGDAATERTLEDARLGRQMDARDDAAAAGTIADYDSRFDVWGFKRPSMLLHAARTEGLFRNPRYIFTHRDFFAIGLRNEIAIARGISDSLRRCVEASGHIYRLMETSAAPSLHLSFEAMIGDRLRAAEVIRDFVRPEAAGTPIDRPDFEAFMDARLRSYFS